MADKTLPTETWDVEHDRFCLNLCYQHGYDNWFSSFPAKYKKFLSETSLAKHAKNDRKSTNLDQKSTKTDEQSIKKENSAENDQSSTNLDHKDRKTSENNTENNPEKWNNLDQNPTTAVPPRTKIKKRFLSFLFRAKPHVQNFFREKIRQQKRAEALSAQKLKPTVKMASMALKPPPLPPKPKMTKALVRAFRRFVTTFPVRNPGLEASWHFFDKTDNIFVETQKKSAETEKIADIKNGHEVLAIKNLKKVDIAKKTKNGQEPKHLKTGRQPFEMAQECLELKSHGMGGKEMWEAFKKLRWEVELLKNGQMDSSNGSAFDLTHFGAKKVDLRLRLFEDVFRVLAMKDLRERLAKLSGAKSPGSLLCFWGNFEVRVYFKWILLNSVFWDI